MRDTERILLFLTVGMLSSGCGGPGKRDQEGGSRQATSGNQAGEGTRPAGGRTDRASRAAMVFVRQREAREGAFHLLVPQGWSVEGGIVRVDPGAAGGPANAIEAKVDFAVKRGAAGSVMLRWLPDMLYFDARRTPAGQMGLFPPGSTYQGMTVQPLMSAQQFLLQVALPRAHGAAGAAEVVDRRDLPEMARDYGQRMQAMIRQPLTFS